MYLFKFNKSTVAVGILLTIIMVSCGTGRGKQSDPSTNLQNTESVVTAEFNADSAYAYVRKQTEFGPRVPNTQPHLKCGDWLESELKRHGAKVITQTMQLQSFDGTTLNSRNILGQYNPESTERLLLMAHWDTRPWADNDPDESNHKKAMDGANDGASGVGVLLETARQIQKINPTLGIDILFLDAEDWGSHNDDASWALGAEYFVKNPIIENYRPFGAILLDMVGGRGSKFMREYQSQLNASMLNDAFWNAAYMAGMDEYFINDMGGAVTDDHVKFLKAGIPAIDIIAYDSSTGSGFPPTWHTMADNMSNIDANVLGAVGKTLMTYIMNLNTNK